MMLWIRLLCSISLVHSEMLQPTFVFSTAAAAAAAAAAAPTLFSETKHKNVNLFLKCRFLPKYRPRAAY